MGPSGSGAAATAGSFLGRFSKGIDLTSMKEKTRAASASLSDKTKAASASISGKMTSIGSTLMSVAKKSEDHVLPQPSTAAPGIGSGAPPAPLRNLPPPVEAFENVCCSPFTSVP